WATPAVALDCEKPLKIFQFPADAIPRVDGDTSDWAMVGSDYAIGNDRLAADDGSGRRPDPASIDVSVKVGWVKGLNRLYFLYEATDDYWDFGELGLKNDIFELVVDGDRSGGPLIARFHPDIAPRPGQPVVPGKTYLSDRDAWFGFQNIHAQNYHIFTPAGDKDWAMAWGPQAAWIKRLPWSNIASRYHFKPGEAGKLTMEFWITPFDYAAPDGAARSVETELTEDKIIAMAWAVIDQDGPKAPHRGFWNLSPKHSMYGQASELCPFRLMPLEAALRKPIQADWSFRILDVDRRVVAFRDEPIGKTVGWKWDFGDGQSSAEQHPIHSYAQPGKFVVTLEVTGPAGASKLSKVWDVSFTGDPPK
ncbi:MAG: PKD domain-containing protein, partial [Sphingomonas bacterium]